MKQIIVISDFIEGQPVVASVRYKALMKFLDKKYSMAVINNECFGDFSSEYAKINYKFHTMSSKFTQNLSNSKVKTGYLEKLLRNRLVLSIWRNYCCSKYKFVRQNQGLFKELDLYIKNNNVSAVLVTVPDIYGIYIGEYIKNLNKDIYLFFEIRDILNHNIGKGNPKYVIKKAEKTLIKIADGIITLSDGIYNYYRKFDYNKKMTIIRNGYDTDEFNDCEYKQLQGESNIRFAHVGSIYKGRNLKDFIYALIKLNKLTGIEIEFNVVGYLDSEAQMDMQNLESELSAGNVKVNILGMLPHEDAIKYLKESHIAVILTHKKGSDYAIPGKTFEYIGACKPIIAVTEDKELIELINNKYGECACHSQSDILEKILKIIKSSYSFNDRLQFSRENQVNKIISFIEGINEEKEIEN